MQASYLTLQGDAQTDQWAVVKTSFPTVKENEISFSASMITLKYPLSRTDAEKLAQKISKEQNNLPFFTGYPPRVFSVSTYPGNSFLPIALADGKVTFHGVATSHAVAIQNAKTFARDENERAKAHNAQYSDKKVGAVYIHAIPVVDI